MSSTSATSSVNGNDAVTQLVRQVMAEADANSDGAISTSEFTAFLTKLLGTIPGLSTAAKGALNGTTSNASGGASAASSTGGDGAAADVLPSTWTSNNAPYGVTLAGFSPQDHTGLSLDDLANAQNAKYAAYNYLLSQKITPDSSWAPGVAAALNQKYNTTLFQAFDGETLGYGDEYIHSAPNGYGMLSGTHNPSATGEFLWGAA